MHKCIRLLHETAIPQVDELFGFEMGIFAIDVFGGVFCLHDTVFYFAPDILDFENLEISRETWDEWAESEKVDKFYEAWYWAGMDNDLSKLEQHECFSIYPPLWAKECDMNTTSKKPIGDKCRRPAEGGKPQGCSAGN